MVNESHDNFCRVFSFKFCKVQMPGCLLATRLTLAAKPQTHPFGAIESFNRMKRAKSQLHHQLTTHLICFHHENIFKLSHTSMEKLEKPHFGA